MGLGARLAIFFASVAAATALLVGGASYVTTDRQVTAEIDQFLVQRAREISNGQRGRPPERRDGDSGDAGDDVVVSVSPDAEVQILDREGEVVTNTDLLLPVDDADLVLADKKSPPLLRTIEIDGVEFRMITEHLGGGGAVQVARSLDESVGLLNTLQIRIIVTSGVVALAAAGAGWVVAQRTTRPLRSLSDAVDEVAETRDFSIPVPTSGQDEVGRLGAGFNRMLGALQRSEDQQHRLVQDAAHELRTPLTSVTANVDWLIRAPELEPGARAETLASVRRELGELNDVMAEIIELATDSREPTTMAATDLTSLVEDVVERFALQSGREVELHTVPVMVTADADSLSRAITNLLSNADKYSPLDAAIGLESGPDGVFVDDAGPGIPPDERNNVFDRFYRRPEDRAMPGSGLGLSIVARIVEQHGGSVSVDDSSRGGARVGFTLPLA